MAEYLLRIGKHRWPIIGLWPCPPFMSDGGRTWRGLLEFKQFRLYLEYSENDNPHMFVGKDMQGVKNPGNVLAIDSPNRVEFTNAGILKVRMEVQQMADHSLTTGEIALLGPIYNLIEDSESAKPPIGDAATVEAVSSKGRRKHKDVCPRWGDEERRIYDIKIHEMIMEGKSGRQIARDIPDWAERHSMLKGFKIPQDRSLQGWAKAELKNIEKKRKRAH